MVFGRGDGGFGCGCVGRWGRGDVGDRGGDGRWETGKQVEVVAAARQRDSETARQRTSERGRYVLAATEGFQRSLLRWGRGEGVNQQQITHDKKSNEKTAEDGRRLR